MTALRLLNLWLHLAAAFVWIGASASVALLWLPHVRAGIDPASWEELIFRIARRYVRWAWAAIHLLLLTGVFNLLSAGVAHGFAFPAEFLTRLIAKLLIVVVMIGAQIGLGLAWVPRLARRDAGGAAERAVRRALVATGIGGGVALWLGMMLGR
ncbi:MAG: CopD family protein [Candidatus Methylomirabilaceae bacterium]